MSYIRLKRNQDVYKRRNLSDCIKNSENTEQFIEKCSQPNTKYKSKAMMVVTYKLIKEKKPISTSMQLINPSKLDINKIKSNAKLTKITNTIKEQ